MTEHRKGEIIPIVYDADVARLLETLQLTLPSHIIRLPMKITAKKVKIDRECTECSKPFTTNQAHKVYCSPGCRKAVGGRRWRKKNGWRKKVVKEVVWRD